MGWTYRWVDLSQAPAWSTRRPGHLSAIICDSTGKSDADIVDGPYSERYKHWAGNQRVTRISTNSQAHKPHRVVFAEMYGVTLIEVLSGSRGRCAVIMIEWIFPRSS